MARVKKKKKKSIFAFLIRFIFKILILAGILYGVLTYVLVLHRQTGNNMFPSVKDGDGCILYQLDGYHGQDVVLYKTPAGVLKMGRIVAVPSQVIDFPESGGFLVNDFQPTEEITYQTFRDEKDKIDFPLEVKEGTYFIMNDFRSDTKDSRQYGLIKEEQIEGKLIFILRRRSF